jgi:hypothetical protein
MWDFTTPPVKETVERHYNAGKLLSSVCHGPAGFVKPVDKKGEPIVKGKKVRARQMLRRTLHVSIEGNGVCSRSAPFETPCWSLQVC